jgi:NAD(P)-dependent dehydrogenase (short-subunit alcohol dehydrogenase family)
LHRVLLISRTIPDELLDLSSQYPDRVRLFASDLSHDSSGAGAVEQALSHTGSMEDLHAGLAAGEMGELHGVVVNHGTLGEVSRIADSSTSGWLQTFHVNLFSVVSIVQAALPALRKSKGTIVFTSSGAATSAYAGWGAYGASKAALNHLAMTLKVEEGDVTTISVRPGVVDSEMQREIREVHSGTGVMDEKDRVKFREAKEKGTLLRPEQPGNVIARLVVGAPRELSGVFVSWNDEVLQEFQD